PCKGAVVKEGRLQRNVADRRSPKLIPVIRVTGHLLQAEVFVLTRAVERHVAHDRSNLRNSDDVRSKIAKHFVGRARNFMTFNTPGFSKEKERSAFLLVSQGVELTSRKLIYWSIRKNKGELEFGDRQT